MENKKETVNELLFFIQNKLHCTTKDAIVEICVKFNSLDEIQSAISCLESALRIRLSKRHKSDDLQQKLVTDLYDKIWSLDASPTQIRFLAADLSRIPRETDSESCATIEQMLASVHNLRTAVSHLQSKMVTQDVLDATLTRFYSNSVDNISNTNVNDNNDDDRGRPSNADSITRDGGLSLHPSNLPPRLPSAPLVPLSPSAPSLSQETPATFASAAATATAATTAAAAAAAATSSSSISASLSLNNKRKQDVIQRQRGKVGGGGGGGRKNTNRDKNSAVIIGQNVNSGVVSWRGADLTVSRYIGRVALNTTAEEISSWLESKNVDVVSIEAIPTKHQCFSSFKLVIKKAHLETISERDFWPMGVLVGPWWPPKKTTEVEPAV